MIFLDTHILLWLARGDDDVPRPLLEALAEGRKFVTSAVVACEYVDLHRRGRFRGGPSFQAVIEGLSLTVLATPETCWQAVADLPPIHRDPVDRMLIAHTIVAGATLATADRKMRQYPVSLLW